MITLFKTENCKACVALYNELVSKNIDFNIETDIEVARRYGIRSAPALIREDGTVLRTPAEIVQFIKKV
jgi:predicted DsbA family dithiol-disulfide isomerase